MFNKKKKNIEFYIQHWMCCKSVSLNLNTQLPKQPETERKIHKECQKENLFDKKTKIYI